MIPRIKFFISYIIFWLSYYMLAKISFLLYHFEQTSELDGLSIVKIFLYGLRMDMAMVGYIMLIAGLILILCSNNRRALKTSFTILTLSLLTINSLLIAADMELYRIWGYRLDASPLLYIQTNAKGAFALGNNWIIIRQIIICFVLIVGFWKIYKLIFIHQIERISYSGIKPRLLILLLTVLMILPIRGTLGMVPLNVGFVYFHNSNMFANHSAINIFWNFLKSATKLNSIEAPHDFFDQNLTNQIWAELHNKTKNENTLKIISSNRPNIILIILENYTAKFIKQLGGKSGITPNIDTLINEGVLFSNFYANGDRTERGLVSVLSAYPPHPTTSIIKFPTMTQKLPFLNKILKQEGYAETGFISGYDLTYANFRSYFNSAQFDRIISQNDFSSSIKAGKWGIDDHYVFNKMLQEVNQMKQPFFELCITLSSHHPFDVPMPTVIKGDDEEAKFMNSAYYADSSLGTFIKEAKKQSWWKDTWVIITADHGNPLPYNIINTHDGNFKIPMIWAGGAVARKDTVINTFGGQIDIAQSILGQLNIESGEFKFSRDLCSPNVKSFSFYTFNNGFGYVNDSVKLVFDNASKKYMNSEPNTRQFDLNAGKACLQMIYNDMNNN